MRLAKAHLVVLAIIAACAAPASAAPILQVNASGILTGALDVDVQGTLYDVSFVDGSCAALFDGCDSVADFAFTSFAAAMAASQALLDQVLLDSASGNFDSEPGLTSGCAAGTSVCEVLTPYGIDVPGFASAIGAQNTGLGDGTPGEPVPNSADFAGGDPLSGILTFARWTPAAPAQAPVPEPATISLFGLGLAGLAARRWRGRALRRR